MVFDAQKKALLHLLDRMHGLRALVIGDAMLDHYITGAVHRISPEAPVPVVQHQQETFQLGGAANVVQNLVALGAEVTLCTVIGADEQGGVLLDRLRQITPHTSAIIASLTRPTTVKTRIIGNGQQMLRIDREVTHELSAGETAELLRAIAKEIDQNAIDVIIFEDYDKGVVTAELITSVAAYAAETRIPVVVDPKHRNLLNYRNVRLLKPNFKELCDAVPFSVEKTPKSLKKATDYLRSRLEHHTTLVTLSEQGVWIDDGQHGKLYPTRKVQVADVSGAGDTVMSIIALAVCLGAEPDQLALLANLAGGQVCEKNGVVPVNKKELIAEIKRLELRKTQNSKTHVKRRK